MGASRYMAVAEHRDSQLDRSFKPGDMVTGSEYERMGDPAAFRVAEFPEQVAALREEFGLDDQADAADVDLEGLNIDQLQGLAREAGVEGRSQMNKAQLINALLSS